jgi:DNA-binding CsgD family transcriptional regulator
MQSDERLSHLISNIYDAALDSTLWASVLEQIAQFVGGPAASLYSKDVVIKSANVAYQFGLDPLYVELYVERYAKFDPTGAAHLFAEIEEPIATADVMPYDEFLDTRFYREWAKPQGLVDTVNTVLEKSLTSLSCLIVFRHERNGLVDDETRRRMRLIAPHVRRAALIGKVIDLKRAQAETFADALDGISAGMYLVDAIGRIVHANIAGHVMLDSADVLSVAGGRLIAADPQADQALAESFTAVGHGEPTVGTKGIAVALTARNGRRYIAHVLPLTAGARRRAGASYAAAAALFVHEAALETPSSLEVIAKTYKLTPTELRVLLAIVEVGGVPEVADALGIAETTVKTHLGRLYGKTDTHRQADLVKLVAGFANPLLG